ncbi:mannose-1-phosphate guanylyltransferase/mannose-6-phosphate isomerase [Acetobacter sp. LMG 32666]|uniref:mannose-1-phosphate guanylyltransferase/mannose-6-phosphate isomerase n=1 Tax=Acetobacter sp. LMG 32666 TaxID=2959295 RepID=UPI0030C7D0BF
MVGCKEGSGGALEHGAVPPVVPVILSGGAGSRLWPVSRGSFPKQFWSLLTNFTLLQDTALRGQSKGLADPVVVCNGEHRFVIAEQLRDVGIRDARIILEPVGRNSAPAITAAAFVVAEHNPDAVLWVMAADAAIEDVPKLHTALDQAVMAAKAGYLVTFGMTPTRPETGYGYIEQGEEIPGIPGVYRVSHFVEKPDKDKAVALLAQGGYLWNSGMFVVRAATFLSEIEVYEPELYACVKESVKNRKTDMDFERLDPDNFSKSPDISVDYAVAERTEKAAVVPGCFGWSDVGSWDALWELGQKDAQGNVTHGNVMLEGVSQSYVRTDGMLAAVMGVDNLVIVATQDAVLVASKDRAQGIKTLVQRMKNNNMPEADTHRLTYRPWGYYEALTAGHRFQVKKIVVRPGQKLSLQKHYHRAEHWVVVEGTALVTRGDEQIIVRENESIYLPLGSLHRLENPGRMPVTLIEVQSGSYLGEDDIVRFDDIYSRTV